MKKLTWKFVTEYSLGWCIFIVIIFNSLTSGPPAFTQVLKWHTTLWVEEYQEVENYAYDNYGQDVAVGDVNGDGYDDIVVSSHTWIKIYEGPIAALDGWSWAQPMIQIGPRLTQYEPTYSAVVLVDVNGDGLQDIIFGEDDIIQSGGSLWFIYAFYGNASWTTGNEPLELDESDADWTAQSPSGTSGGAFGKSLANAGDMSGNGIDELAVGAPVDGTLSERYGKVYVFYGSTTGLPASGTPSKTLDAADYTYYETWGLNYPIRTQGFGWDVDRGGRYATTDDLIIGCPYSDVDINKNGAYGSDEENIGMASGRLPTPKFLPGNKGEPYSDYKNFGYSVGYAGDVNGDGLPEVLVCALPRYSWRVSPKVFLFLGEDEYGYPLKFVYDWSVEGLPDSYPLYEADTDAMMPSELILPVGSAGDLNKDGYGDIYIGDRTYNPDETKGNDGRVYIWYGGAPTTEDPSGLGQNQTPATADIILDPDDITKSSISGMCASFGYSVAFGDIDGDDKNDIVVGDPYCYHPYGGIDPGVQTGAVHVFLSGGTAPQEPDPPTGLVALNGYHQAVPLAWKAPANTEDQTLLGYNLYRTTETEEYVQVATQITETFFRDETVTNGETYAYTVSTVYSAGESEKSGMVSATPAENGYRTKTGWTNQVPTIDGQLSTGEWSNAGSCNIIYPGESGTITMYLMNDENYLYLAVDDPTDTKLNSYDTVGLFFDEDYNRIWPATSNGAEGLLRFYYENGETTAWYQGFFGTWPDISGQSWAAASGVDASISTSSGHLQYEARIDLANSPINPADTTIGWGVYMWEGGSSQVSAIWPQEMANKLEGNWANYTWMHGSFSYGDLIFGEEVVNDNTIIFMDPATKNIKLSQTDTVKVTIENVIELSGFEFTIDYDPTIVKVSDASAVALGNFLGSTGRSVIPLTPSIDNTTGQMSYTAASFGSQTCPSGNGILARIIWTAVGMGTSQLDLSSAQITDPMGDPMTVTLVDGQIVVIDTHFADLDGDGDVDIVDIQKVAAHYGIKEGDPDWDSTYDIDGDGDVDIVDVQKVAAWYGKDISGGATPKVNIKPDTRQSPIRLRSVLDADAHALDLYIERGALLGGFELTVSSTQKLPEIESIQLGELFEGRHDNVLLLEPFTSKNKFRMTLGLCTFNQDNENPDAGHALRIIFKDNPEPLSIQGIQCVDVYGKVMSSGNEMINASPDMGAIPDKYILYQNYPNPFNPFTEIPFEVKEQGQASLVVYNLKGEQIRTIFKRIIKPGKHTCVWDGKNDYGEKVGSGVYVYVLRIGSVKQMKKMIYMK